MAGEDRYRWLDEDVAERLLRGEPADSLGFTGGAAWADARRLAAALSAVSVGAPGPSPSAVGCAVGESVLTAPVQPLPGEEAALAAFREAHMPGADARSAYPSVRTLPLDRRRFGWSSARPHRRAGSLRAGLAAALAVCALGGVAVAAGTGVLPTPFGHVGKEPGPATSVSAAAPPAPSVSESPSLLTGKGSASPEPSRPDASGGTSSSVPGPGGDPTGGTGGDPEAAPGTLNGLLSDDLQPKNKGEEKKLDSAIELCRQRETGPLPEKDERQLEHLVGGDAVEGSCGWLLEQFGSGSDLLEDGEVDADDEGKGPPEEHGNGHGHHSWDGDDEGDADDDGDDSDDEESQDGAPAS